MAIKKPKLLIATPEIIVDLPEGMGNLSGRILNYKTGGMADVNSTFVRELAKNDDIDLHVAIPWWKSSSDAITQLTEKENRIITEALMEQNIHMIKDASFNRVIIKGSNTMMYDDGDYNNDHTYNSIDRAIAFDRAIINWLLPSINPDVVWVNDWMLGLVPAGAKAQGIRSLTTGHNNFTHYISENDIKEAHIDMGEIHPYLYRKTNSDLIDLFSSEIFASDYFTTVSQNYLEEMVEGKIDGIPEEVLGQIREKYNSGRAKGILNPRENTNSNFFNSLEQFSLDTIIAGRKENTLKLKSKVKLNQNNSPVLIFPNRLFSGQKNPEIALNIAPILAKKYGIQTLFIANGTKDLENKAKWISKANKGNISYVHFDGDLENLALKSDSVYGFMTSNYEPCGRPNIYFPGEGIPVLGHAIGGIADSVQEIDIENNRGNGFPYDVNDHPGIEYAAKKLIEFNNLSDKKRYAQLTRIAKENIFNNSPKSAISKYVDIIMQLYDEKMYDEKHN